MVLGESLETTEVGKTFGFLVGFEKKHERAFAALRQFTRRREREGERGEGGEGERRRVSKE